MQLQVRLRLDLAGEHAARLRQRPQDLLLPLRHEDGGLPKATGAQAAAPRSLPRFGTLEEDRADGRNFNDRLPIAFLTLLTNEFEF